MKYIWGSVVRKIWAKAQLYISKIYASKIACVIEFLQQYLQFKSGSVIDVKMALNVFRIIPDNEKGMKFIYIPSMSYKGAHPSSVLQIGDPAFNGIAELLKNKEW